MIHLLQLGRVDYATGLDLQRTLVDLRKRGEIGDVLLLLEHSPVITLGRTAKRTNLLASSDILTAKGVELFETDRGGDVTFHGPGQLVGYPIFDLRGFSPRVGAVEFVRRLEEALIRALGEYGVLCSRVDGATGVWVDGERKIAAIGVHISRAVTSHGFALNVTTDLDYFKLIIPCGIATRPVTSLEQELREMQKLKADGPAVPEMLEMGHCISRHFGNVFRSQVLHLESLDQLLEFAKTASSATGDSPVADSPVIDDRLRTPQELKHLRRSTIDRAQPGTGSEGVFSGEDEELFLA